MARVAQKSKEQGYSTSRLPEFTEDEKTFIKGSSDFFGVNHYTSFLVSANNYKDDYRVPSLLDDLDTGMYVPDEWLKSASPWLTVSLLCITFTPDLICIESILYV